MKKYQHELLTVEMVKDNAEEMYSYDEMRKVLLDVMKSARGGKKLYLKQTLDILDLCCEMSLHSDNQQEIESEIYSILS